MEVLDTAKAVFARNGIEPNEKDGTLSTSIRTGLVGSRMKVSRNVKFIFVTVEIPIFVPDYRRQAMAETVCRANWGLCQGRFEVDLADDAELRFRSSMPLLDAEPTEQQLDCLIFQSWSIVNHYVSALAEVAIGMLEPAVAIEKAEVNWREKIRDEAPNEAAE